MKIPTALMRSHRSVQHLSYVKLTRGSHDGKGHIHFHITKYKYLFLLQVYFGPIDSTLALHVKNRQ